MQTIWKYPVTIADEFNLEIPEGAQLLSVAMQPGIGPVCWALVDDEAPLLLDDEPLLLEDNPVESSTWSVSDNTRCHVCHMNY